MSTKKCSTCGVEKALEKFPRNGIDKDGNERRRADCTVCYNICRKANSRKGKRSFSKFVNNMKHRTGEKAALTLAEWRECLIYFEGCCAYCGKQQSRSIKLSKDHVLPVVLGGLTEKHNTVPACVACNSSKQEESFEKWYHGQRFFDAARYARIKEWIGDGD